jgi:hypothetical protein
MKDSKDIRKETLIKWIKTDVVLISVGLLYYLILYFIGDTCLIKFVFNKECPCCGMTRAILCLIRFDFTGYFKYNLLALPTFVFIYCYLHVQTEKYKKFFNIALVILAMAILMRFIFINT